MRVLFDQATPVPIRTFLIGHTVRTAAQEHWDTLQNGDLLTVAEHAGFDVFLLATPLYGEVDGEAVTIIGQGNMAGFSPHARQFVPLNPSSGTTIRIARCAGYRSVS
jgi:hypothetical protein